MTGRPVITIDPAVRFGRPQIGGIRVDVLADLIFAGEPVEEMAEECGVTRADVLTACWWVGLDGPRKFRRLWGDWANGCHEALARGQYDKISDPPAKERR